MTHSLGTDSSHDTSVPSGIEMPLRELGRQALLLLLERRQTPKRPVRTVLLSGRLVAGNMTGPPPRSE
jgi:DNA-binding LacI/PurR family transcriptional regulator